MKSVVPSVVSRALAAIRAWLREAWVSRVSLFEGLRSRRGRAAAPSSVREVQLRLEWLEPRETPDDIAGVLAVPVAGALLTPPAAIIQGWAGLHRPTFPLAHHLDAADWQGHGLGGPAWQAAAGDPWVPAWVASLPAGTPPFWAGPAPGPGRPDAVHDVFADPLTEDWLAAVGTALAAHPHHASPPGGASFHAPHGGAGALNAAPPAPAFVAPDPGLAPGAAAPSTDYAASQPVNAAPPPAPASNAAPAPAPAADPAPAPVPVQSNDAPAPAPANASGSDPLGNGLSPNAAATVPDGSGTVGTQDPAAGSFLQAYGSTPLAFEPNVGQSDPSVVFLSHGPGFTAFFTANSAVFAVAPSAQSGATTPDVLTLSFAAANPTPQVYAQNDLQSRSNYFTGSDPSKWLTDVPNYGTVVYHDLYPGIDLAFSGNASRQLEFSFVVAPGADPSQIRMNWQGATSIQQDNQGDLVITLASGQTITQSAPVLYQIVNGVKTPVAATQVVNEDGSVGFQVGAYDPTQPLVIDPSLLYSSYFGGSGDDKGYAISVDKAGDAYIAGSTASSNFPTAGAYQSGYSGNTDAFVAKLNASGGLVYSTYLGGSGTDVANGIAVDLAGNAWVVGSTASSNFPTAGGPYQGSLGAGGGSAFAARLSPTGDALDYSTYLGNSTSSTIAAQGVAVDAQGNAYLTGYLVASSSLGYSFPTTSGAFQTSPGSTTGGYDGFVAKLAPTSSGASLAYSSYLGGSSDDEAFGIAVDQSGDAYVTGWTRSSAFPTTTGAFKTSFPGMASQASFVTKVNAAGSALSYSTYLAGSTSGSEGGLAIAVDATGAAYVTGDTFATNFPTTAGAFQTSGGTGGAFVAKLNPAGSGLGYGTYLSSSDVGQGVAVDAYGRAVVVGLTSGSTFPTVAGAFQSTGGGGTDAFVVRLNAGGTGLDYGSYLGGSGTDEAMGVGLDALGNAYLTGFTNSANFPTAGSPYQGGLATAGYDAFVSKVSPLPAAPVINAVSTDTGSSSTDQITNSQNLHISGTAVPGVTVTLWSAGVQLGTVTANATTGAWSYDYSATTLPEGVTTFTAQQTVGGLTSPMSPEFLVTVDLTAPAVVLTAPASTASLQPQISVTASDLNGLPNGTAVGILVYASNGTTLLYSNSSAATLTDGQASFRLPYALTAGTNYVLKAQVSDLAGNQGTSAGQNLSVTSVSAFAYAAQQLVSDPLGGNALFQAGDAQLSAGLNLDQSGGGAGGYSALVYNSDAVSSKPIIQATINTPNNATLPATITATLTWNGTAGSTQNFSTTGMSPGDVLTLAVQVPTAVTTTGRYGWSLLIQISGQPNQTITGATFVVAQDASPFGAGWTFGATDRLVSIAADANGPAGMLRVFGTGEYSFYVGTTTFTSPADDNGTLSLSGGVYTYTYADGRTQTFNSSGYETQAASADGQQTLQFRYDVSNRVTGMTAIDGALTTISYSSSQDLIQTLSRVTTLSLDASGNLTKVTNPDGGLHTYSYDTGHRVTGETFANLQNEWAYATNGALTTMTAGSAVVGGITNLDYTALTPADVQGLGTLVAGTVMATEKDPDGHTTGLQLDSQGRTLKQVAPDGGASPYQYDANGRVTVATDQLGRATTYALDTLGYVTLETFPDGSTVGFQYQTAFHALISMTDQRGETTTSAYDASGHLTSTTDALGETTKYGYNASGLETSVTDPLNHITTYAYDTDRRLTTVTDALNDVTSYAYDANGYGLTTTDPLGRVTTTLYDVMGRLTKTTDALGNSATMAYNAAGLELSATDELGRLSQPVYDTFNRGLVASTLQAVGTPVQVSALSSFDSAGQTTKTRNANGAWTNAAFDPLGRVTQTVNALNGKTQTMFDKAGQTPAMRDELGRLTQQGYDVMGRVTTTTDAQGNVTTTAYDLGGNVTAVTDPLGHATTTLYDALGRATTTIDPLGHRATTTYDAAGNLSTTTDFNGRLTSYAYDADNRRTTVTDPLGNVMTTAYDAVGNVTAATDPLGHTTTALYDALNRATVSIDSLGHRTTSAYDKLGNVTTVTDPLNKTVSYAYDQLNRLLTTISTIGLTTTQIDDANGNRIAAIDPLGNYTQTVVDALDRPVETVDLKGAVTQTKPDAPGQTTAVTDAVGNTTQYLYDTLGRQTVAIDPLGNRTTTTYDTSSRVSTTTDADGHQQVFHYDNANRVTAETWLSSGGVTVNLLTFTYDNNGSQLTAADYSGTYTNSYDADNRLTAQTDPFGLTLTYQYDTANRVTQRADSLGGVLTSVYDTSNRLTTREFGGAGLTPLRVDFAYTNRNELSSLTRYSDLAGTNMVGTTVYAYDDSSRLTSIVNKTGANATLSYYQYTLDNASRVTQESWQSLTTTGSVLSGTHTYAYDSTNQLTADGPTLLSFDANGNQTMPGYTTGSANELSNDGVYTYTYDAAGDMTKKSKGAVLETWYFGYDTLNRLTSVRETTDGTTNELTLTYTYDVYGNRSEQDLWQTGGVVTVTRTAYDGSEAWADVNGSNVIQTRYIAGNGINQWLARIDAAGVEWLNTDRLGSVRDVVNAAGTQVLDHVEYTAFGAVTSDTNAAVAGAYGADGLRYERLTGMLHAFRRDEETWARQWTTPDPIGIGAGDGNFRRPETNDPTNLRDPSGLFGEVFTPTEHGDDHIDYDPKKVAKSIAISPFQKLALPTYAEQYNPHNSDLAFTVFLRDRDGNWKVQASLDANFVLEDGTVKKKDLMVKDQEETFGRPHPWFKVEYESEPALNYDSVDTRYPGSKTATLSWKIHVLRENTGVNTGGLLGGGVGVAVGGLGGGLGGIGTGATLGGGAGVLGGAGIGYLLDDSVDATLDVTWQITFTKEGKLVITPKTIRGSFNSHPYDTFVYWDWVDAWRNEEAGTFSYYWNHSGHN